MREPVSLHQPDEQPPVAPEHRHVLLGDRAVRERLAEVAVGALVPDHRVGHAVHQGRQVGPFARAQRQRLEVAPRHVAAEFGEPPDVPGHGIRRDELHGVAGRAAAKHPLERELGAGLEVAGPSCGHGRGECEEDGSGHGGPSLSHPRSPGTSPAAPSSDRVPGARRFPRTPVVPDRGIRPCSRTPSVTSGSACASSSRSARSARSRSSCSRSGSAASRRCSPWSTA